MKPQKNLPFGAKFIRNVLESGKRCDVRKALGVTESVLQDLEQGLYFPWSIAVRTAELYQSSNIEPWDLYMAPAKVLSAFVHRHRIQVTDLAVAFPTPITPGTLSNYMADRRGFHGHSHWLSDLAREFGDHIPVAEWIPHHDAMSAKESRSENNQVDRSGRGEITPSSPGRKADRLASGVAA